MKQAHSCLRLLVISVCRPSSLTSRTTPVFRSSTRLVNFKATFSTSPLKRANMVSATSSQPDANTSTAAGMPPPGKPRKIVLCFDGTTNKFTGDDSDTNVVKLYKMLDRTTNDQYHYYQPGIGTYPTTPLTTSSWNPFSNLSNKISGAADEGFAFSFVDHVLGGYRFLMNHYMANDRIYIFGFSRGAYTARFLAEMVYHIGLLSRGNEEMVRFAWMTFSQYQAHIDDMSKDGLAIKKQTSRFMEEFKKAFCRGGTPVHFLGLFDCVNSVAGFEIPFGLGRKTSPYIPVPAATFIRHAVSLHERRAKFKPALFNLGEGENGFTAPEGTDIKEVWFAGSHTDVGGGWDVHKHPGTNKDGSKEMVPDEGPLGKYLLSDVPLHWMVEEILKAEITLLPSGSNEIDTKTDQVDGAKKSGSDAVENVTKTVDQLYAELGKPDQTLRDLGAPLNWQVVELEKMAVKAEELMKAVYPPPSVKKSELNVMMHDSLAFGRGAPWYMVIFWWIQESLPMKRYEYHRGTKKWEAVSWPPNFGNYRDCPGRIVKHESLNNLIANGVVTEKSMPAPEGSKAPEGFFARLKLWFSGQRA